MVEVEKEREGEGAAGSGAPASLVQGAGRPPPTTGRRGGTIPGRPWVGRGRRERAP